jgi:hypothetical protein
MSVSTRNEEPLSFSQEEFSDSSMDKAPVQRLVGFGNCLHWNKRFDPVEEQLIVR